MLKHKNGHKDSVELTSSFCELIESFKETGKDLSEAAKELVEFLKEIGEELPEILKEIVEICKEEKIFLIKVGIMGGLTSLAICTPLELLLRYLFLE